MKRHPPNIFLMFARCLLLCAVLLPAIVFAQEPEPISQGVLYIGPQNDLNIENRAQSFRTSPRIPQGKQTISFPLALAVECQSGKTNCKHAIVSTTLELEATALADHSIAVAGVLRSKMGRSIYGNVPDRLKGYFNMATMSVKDNAPLLGETSSEGSFEKKLQRREPLELDGLAGVKVVVSFVPKPQ